MRPIDNMKRTNGRNWGMGGLETKTRHTGRTSRIGLTKKLVQELYVKNSIKLFFYFYYKQLSHESNALSLCPSSLYGS